MTLTMTGRVSDAAVIGEIERSGGLYERDVAALLRRVLPPDGVAIDAGAHIGVMSALMARIASEGRVIAFEPAPDSHQFLQANLAANRIANVTVERAALHSVDATLRFAFNDVSPSGSSVSASGSSEVAATRLDTWVREHGLVRLDLVKMDVEGAEMAALEGAAETFRRLGPVLVIECNPVTSRRFGNHSWRDLFDQLRSMFALVALVGRGGRPVAVCGTGHLRRALAERGVVDLICFPHSPGRARLAALAAGASSAATLWRRERWSRPPANNFVIDPDVDLVPAARELTAAPAAVITVPVEVVNRSRTWLSTEFAAHPVHLSYRMRDETGALVVHAGHATPLRHPVAPGATVAAEATVVAPAEAGRYLLDLTLVQQAFAWFDDLDPACTGRVTLTVSA